MPDKYNLPSTTQDQFQYLDIDTQFDDSQLQLQDHQQDIDLEENYIHRLKIQRKRIQELSQLHEDNQQRLKKQMDKNKSMQEEIARLSLAKDYQIKYNQISSHLETTLHENRMLKEQIITLKEDISQINNERIQAVQKLKYELSLQKNKQSSIIYNLEQELSSKQDEYDSLQRQAKNRQKQLLDTISTLKNKIQSVTQDYDIQCRAEQRKSQRLERELQARMLSMNQLQNIADSLTKENSQMKEELYRTTSVLQNKEQQLRSFIEKYKYKLSSLKKQSKNKDKQLIELRQNMKRQQRQNKDLISQLESLQAQMKKAYESAQIQKHRLQIEFGKQKQCLQLVISQHLSTIEQLVGVKNELLSENKRCLTIIRKKQALEKQRKTLLRSQLKELDKLQRVIDRIVQ